MHLEPLDVKTLDFRVPTGYVRSWTIIFVGGPCREVKALNTSSTTVEGVRELMDEAISSNASFFRSSIVCYHNLR